MSLADALTTATLYNWPLNEWAGGDAVAAVGSPNLTLTGTCPVVREYGGHWWARAFSAGNYFSHANATPFVPGSSDWFLIVFADFNSLSADQIIAFKNTSGGVGIRLRYNHAANKFEAAFRSAGSGLVTVQSSVSPATGTPYQFKMQFDHTAGKVRFAVNGTVETPATISGSVSNDTGEAFYLGADNAGANGVDGNVWDLTIGTGYILTDDDNKQLANAQTWCGGLPRTFSQWPASPLALPKILASAYYPLGESSGSAAGADLVAGNGATQTNTPASRHERNGRARVFVKASGTYLVAGDSAGNSLGTATKGFTILLQAKFDSTSNGNHQGIIAKGDGTNGEWYLALDNGTKQVFFGFYTASGYGGEFDATSALNPVPANTDLLIALKVDYSTLKGSISINNETFVDTPFTGTVYNSAGSLYIGKMTPVAAWAFDGSLRNLLLIPEYCITQSVLNTLYNGGNVPPPAEWDKILAACAAAFSPDEKTATVTVPGRGTFTMPRPEPLPWAYTPAGTTYHVSPSGDNTAAGTSSGTAWRTLDKAAEVAAADDMVIIHSGDYVLPTTLTLGNSGTAGRPVIFTCAAGELGLPRITLASEAGGANQPVVTVSANYVWLNGLTVEGPRGRPEAAFQTGSTQTYSACVGFAFAGLGSQVTNSFLHGYQHCGVKTLTLGDEHGATSQANVIFEGGHGHGDHCHYVTADSCKTKDNLCFRTHGYAVHYYAGTPPADGEITYNVCFENGLAIGVTSEGGGDILINGSNTLVEHNTCYGAGVSSSAGITFYRNGCVNNTVRKNISSGHTYEAFVDSTGGDPSGNTDDFNDYFGSNFNAAVLPLGAGDVNVDPLFVDAAGGDLRLQSGSTVKALGAYAAATDQRPGIGSPFIRGVAA